MNGLDINRRLILAAKEIVEQTSPVTDIVGDHITIAGDISDKAHYPCVTLKVVNTFQFERNTGWYMAHLQLAGNTHQQDDKAMEMLMTLAGHLRTIIQDRDFANKLNATAIASSVDTALTVADIEHTDEYEDTVGTNGRSIGVTCMCLCRPSKGKNKG